MPPVPSVPSAPPRPSVLVTGAGRGIGRAIVDRLAASGWDVIAGVRTDADAAAVTRNAPTKVTSVRLDITDAEQITAVSESLPDRLDALVNNAGIVVGGPLEGVSSEQWRRQLDVNLVGQLAVTRAVLPRLRLAAGRVVFISSVNGRVVFPMLAPYCASKFALEAAAEALRMELKPWHIDVSVVEPAQTDTDIWRTVETLVSETEAGLSDEVRTLYDRHMSGMKKSSAAAKKLAVPVGRVAEVVERALTERRARARYVVGAGPRLQAALLTHMPAPLRDRLLSKLAGVPRRL